MLQKKSALSPQASQYRLVSGLRLVFWIVCLTLGGVGLHLAPSSSHPMEVSAIDADDVKQPFTAPAGNGLPRE